MKRTTNNYKKNSGETVAIIVSTILILAMAAGLLASLSNGFEDWNVKNWFGKDPAEGKSNIVTVDFNVKTLCEGEDGEDWVNNKLTDEQVLALKKSRDITIKVQPVDCVDYNNEEKPVTEPFTLKFFNMFDDESGVIVGYSDTGTFEANVMICFVPIPDSEFSSMYPDGYCFISAYVGTLKFSITYNEDEKGFIESVFDIWKKDEEEHFVIDGTDEDRFSAFTMNDGRQSYRNLDDNGIDVAFPPLEDITVTVVYPATEDEEAKTEEVKLVYTFEKSTGTAVIAAGCVYSWKTEDGKLEYKIAKVATEEGSIVWYEQLISETRCKIIIK